MISEPQTKHICCSYIRSVCEGLLQLFKWKKILVPKLMSVPIALKSFLEEKTAF